MHETGRERRRKSTNNIHTKRYTKLVSIRKTEKKIKIKHVSETAIGKSLKNEAQVWDMHEEIVMYNSAKEKRIKKKPHTSLE